MDKYSIIEGYGYGDGPVYRVVNNETGYLEYEFEELQDAVNWLQANEQIWIGYIYE